LRGKLGESGREPRFIHTVRGVGYRYEPLNHTNGALPASASDPGSSAFLLVTRDGFITWASTSVSIFLDREASELIDRHISELFPSNGHEFPPDFGIPSPSILVEVSQQGSGEPIKPGKIRVRPIVSDQGPTMALVEISIDVEEASDLTGPIPAIQVGQTSAHTTLTYDETLILRSVVPSGEPFLGWQPEEICNTFFLLTSDPAISTDQEQAIALVQAMLDGGMHVIDGPVLIHTASGAVTSVRIQSHLYSDADGKFTGMRSRVIP
jgi:hypothetical protein